MSEIHKLERACIRAWPAKHETDIHGWRAFATAGRSGRVNSAWPLAWRGRDLAAAIEAAEAWAATHNIRAAFKLADGAIHPPSLPDALAQRGYRPETPTLVMTRTLGQTPPPDRLVQLADEPTDSFWTPLRLAAPSPEDFAERADIVLRTTPPRAFAIAQLEHQPAAIGFGDITDGLLGLYLMRTAPNARRQGLARDIVRALCGWGAANGAHTAYLQVEQSNEAAVALYASDGFETAYSYSYWIKP
ncbi:MAG TPA: GNAT family N-acetyltransferase [Vitreimonas sp.]|uniref:GNAT family N-acetyltransferase n=1 Tax=Vitreimonas sp. TaxID=3069702 RepID=UPI002D276612|nr:GNAT family N-acetyltransferase [Vitreimonas sp.]HYD87039.1 GNAT family N-acetyltransferase [Vitreimonas sp.]